MILTTQLSITLIGIYIFIIIPIPIQGRCLSLSKTDTQDFCQVNESKSGYKFILHLFN